MMTPNVQSTIAVTANATPQNVALPLGGGLMVQLKNSGPQMAFVEFTSDANASCAVPGASGGGYPIAANVAAEELFLPSGATRVAVVSAGNSTVYITRGKPQE